MGPNARTCFLSFQYKRPAGPDPSAPSRNAKAAKGAEGKGVGTEQGSVDGRGNRGRTQNKSCRSGGGGFGDCCTLEGEGKRRVVGAVRTRSQSSAHLGVASDLEGHSREPKWIDQQGNWVYLRWDRPTRTLEPDESLVCLLKATGWRMERQSAGSRRRAGWWSPWKEW
eukprot:s7762_g3.t1